MIKKAILHAFHFRHACKEFDPEKKILKEDFEFILETGRLSPSSFGFEPWKLLIVQNKTLRKKLKEHTWGGEKQIPTCSHLIVILARKESDMRYDSQYIQEFMDSVQKRSKESKASGMKYYEHFQKDDFKLFESERALFDWACKQTYIVLANMMTSAALIGIDSCPIEGYNTDQVNRVLKEDFEIDIKRFGISCMVAFGYRKRKAQQKTRQTMRKIMKWFH